MKNIMLVFLIFLIRTTNATNYYFSTLDGDDNRTDLQAQTPLTPWKTIDKLNGLTRLRPGDSVLFKRGETFYGTLMANASGSTGNVIFYGSYGTGPNAVITGFTNLSNWTLLNGNIYYAALNVPSLNMVTLNDVVKGMGRYPNTGYLNYERHVNNTSITDNELISEPNWTDAEVVIRKYRWILDRHPVSSHSGGTLTYASTAAYGNNKVYYPVDGNGYFIQGHLSTLDQRGEWYYDKAAGRFYMHFGSENPVAKVVRASTLDRNLIINSLSCLTFEDIDFEGGNILGAYLVGCSNILFKNCNFRQQGGTGIYGIDVTGITVTGGTVTEALNNGIWVELNGSHVTVDGVALSNIGSIAGAGRSGDAAQEGIHIAGNNTTITNNVVRNTGFNAVNFSGNDVLVEHNFIDSFCRIKDDGGGIYTYLNESVTGFNRVIKNNIVLHSMGAFAGVESFYYEPFGKSAGIYLDGYSNHTKVSGNTLAHGEWGGIFVNNNDNNEITNNLVYDFAQQFLLIETAVGAIRNVTVTNNRFVAKTPEQKTSNIHLYVADNPAYFGTFNNNRYARPIADTATITVHNEYAGGGGARDITLGTWQSRYNQDANSSASPKPITDTETLRFEYNASHTSKTIVLGENYTGIDGNAYTGTLTILPFSSVVLIKNRDQLALPLQFVNLTGERANGKIILHWKAFNQMNTNRFEVEKSSDGIHFKTYRRITSKSSDSTYTLVDYDPFPKKNFYRIKQIDKDGKGTNSKTIAVTSSESLGLSIYPNPSTDKVQVKFTAPQGTRKVNLSLKTIQGIELKRFVYDASAGNVEINTSSLPSGVYSLILDGDNFHESQQIIKQ